MNYSTTYLAVIVNILSVLLPKVGITVGTEELTTTIQTIVAIFTGMWIMIQRYKRGDINVAGFKATYY